MTPIKPLSPPLRGATSIAGAAEPPVTLKRTEAGDSCCTIFDSCDQCSRRLFRPHIANGRAFCGGCCPKCAEEAMLGAARRIGR
jgi:hypothetical protein